MNTIGLTGIAVAGCAALGLVDCTGDRPTGPDSKPAKAGMVWVKAAGKSFLQGSSDEFANPLERPAVMNRFTYDFQLDSTETTQARFQELLGRNPVSKESP